MNPTLWQEVRHFKQSEFDSRDVSGSGAHMRPRLVFMLDALRALMKKPFRINSGFRTPEHNKVVGGAPGSAHLTGEAVDISTSGWTAKEKQDFIIYARWLGFTGVGVGGSFIHIDIKPRTASWVYQGPKIVAVAIGRELDYA